MILVGPQFEGIRCAVVPGVPPGSSYPVCGLGIPRVWPLGQPAFVVDVTDIVCFAHEMGHTFGVNHSVCRGDETWPIDDRLGSTWSSTDEPCMDVETGRVVPRGTPDIMSYCPGDQWPSTRTYGPFFDEAPI